MNLLVNIATVRSSFCQSCASSTYVASSASLSKKGWANGAHEAINHFVRNFAKYSPILKILSPATE